MKVREITKYQNRKLYDRSTGSYVNTEDIEQFITQGDLLIIKDRHGKHITFEQIKSFMGHRFANTDENLDQERMLNALKLGGGTLAGFINFVFENFDMSIPLEEHMKNQEKLKWIYIEMQRVRHEQACVKSEAEEKINLENHEVVMEHGKRIDHGPLVLL